MGSTFMGIMQGGLGIKLEDIDILDHLQVETEMRSQGDSIGIQIHGDVYGALTCLATMSGPGDTLIGIDMGQLSIYSSYLSLESTAKIVLEHIVVSHQNPPSMWTMKAPLIHANDTEWNMDDTQFFLLGDWIELWEFHPRSSDASSMIMSHVQWHSPSGFPGVDYQGYLTLEDFNADVGSFWFEGVEAELCGTVSANDIRIVSPLGVCPSSLTIQSRGTLVLYEITSPDGELYLDTQSTAQLEGTIQVHALTVSGTATYLINTTITTDQEQVWMASMILANAEFHSNSVITIESDMEILEDHAPIFLTPVVMTGVHVTGMGRLILASYSELEQVEIHTPLSAYGNITANKVLIDTVQRAEAFIPSPYSAEAYALEIGELSAGPVTFFFEFLSPTQFPRVHINSTLEPSRAPSGDLKFIPFSSSSSFSVPPSLLLFPLESNQDLEGHVLRTDGTVWNEYDSMVLNEQTFYVAYDQTTTENGSHSFSIHRNSPPVAEPDVCMGSCVGSGNEMSCTCCVDPMSNDSDIDVMDEELLQFSVSNSNPRITANRTTVCMTQSGSETVGIAYRLMDPAGAEVVGMIEFQFDPNTPPASTTSTPLASPQSHSPLPPPPSLSSSPAPSLSSSPSPSRIPTRTPTSSRTSVPSIVYLPPNPIIPSNPPVATSSRSPSRTPSSPNSESTELNVSDELQELVDSTHLCPSPGSCEGGRSQQEISNEAFIPLTLSSGEVVGSVRVPPGVVGSGAFSLDVSFVIGVDSSVSNTGDIVLDINLQDTYGIRQSRLEEEITICLQQPNVNRDEACLGYYDIPRSRWICEDPCLQSHGDSVCGTSGHLTSFAILLSGGAGNNNHDPCDSKEYNDVIAWLSLAFIGVALIFVFIAVVALECMMTAKRRRRKMFTTSLERTHNSTQS